ncbi:hypothetical protein JXL19_05465 [bacterium]|nr:hypothetical protein [bacterium]
MSKLRKSRVMEADHESRNPGFSGETPMNLRFTKGMKIPRRDFQMKLIE